MAETSKTTDQALSVLTEIVDNGPMPAAEVARRLDLNRTVVHRLLATLHRRGFVIRQGNDYLPGPIIIRIAQRLQPELRAAAHEELRRFVAENGETVVLHIPEGNAAVVIDQVVALEHVVQVEHQIGSRHPLGQAASGRVLLAHLGQRATDTALRQADDPEALRAELGQILARGYAISDEELQVGVHGLAVPVVDRNGEILASLAILVPTARSEDLASHSTALFAGAKRVAAALTGDKLAGSPEPVT